MRALRQHKLRTSLIDVDRIYWINYRELTSGIEAFNLLITAVVRPIEVI
jgi:hypothetical protein